MHPARGVRCISIVRAVGPRRSSRASFTREVVIPLGVSLAFGRCTSEVFLSVSIYNWVLCLLTSSKLTSCSVHVFTAPYVLRMQTIRS